MAAVEHTITGADWARSLPAARARRKRRAERVGRVIEECPLCKRPGRAFDEGDGLRVRHDAGLGCWWPAGSSE